MKIKSLLYFAIVLLAFHGCKDDELPKPKDNTGIPAPVDTTTRTRIKRGDTLDICLKNGSVTVNGDFNGVKKYLWMPGGDTTGIKTIDTVGFYTLYITRSGKTRGSEIVDTSFVNAQSCFIIPNAFTPNGDGTNDTWVIDCANMASIEVNIFNRWGNTIYTSTAIPFSWDGNYNGVTQADGTYFYVVKCKLLNGTTKSYKGCLTLLK